MADNNETTLVAARDEAGRFMVGASGNPAGRPKGSKNRVTMLKIMGEEAVRARNIEAMQLVADQIIKEALAGNVACQKLVWNSLMSNGSIEDRASGAERVQINISGTAAEAPKEVPGETIEVSDGKIEANE